MSLISLAYMKQHKMDEALRALDEALILAKPGGFIFPFREFGRPMAGLLERASAPEAIADFVKRILGPVR
jgi:hypothetical protein